MHVDLALALLNALDCGHVDEKHFLGHLVAQGVCLCCALVGLLQQVRDVFALSEPLLNLEIALLGCRLHLLDLESERLDAGLLSHVQQL